MSQPTRTVYLIRRIFLLGILALLIWGIVALFSWVGSWFAPASTPTAIQISESEKCALGTVAVEAVLTDGSLEQSQFEIGVNPHLGYKITNNGATACKWDVGTIAQQFVIKSGEEVIWKNQDCDRSQDVSQIITLKPAETMASNTTSTAWYRVHSSASGCGEGEVPATGGGALYTLTVTISGVISPAKQFLLY